MISVSHALALAMSIGQVIIIPGDAGVSAQAPKLPAQQSYQLIQGEDGHNQGSHDSENYIQQEVLVERYIVYRRAQVVCAIVTEDVADPVDGPSNRVARLVFVNVG